LTTEKQTASERSAKHEVGENTSTVSLKKYPPTKKNFLRYFYLWWSKLCNWKLPWLLGENIPTFTPIFGYLSE